MDYIPGDTPYFPKIPSIILDYCKSFESIFHLKISSFLYIFMRYTPLFVLMYYETASELNGRQQTTAGVGIILFYIILCGIIPIEIILLPNRNICDSIAIYIYVDIICILCTNIKHTTFIFIYNTVYVMFIHTQRIKKKLNFRFVHTNGIVQNEILASSKGRNHVTRFASYVI